MNAKGRGKGVGNIDAREQFDKMLKVCEVIVDRRGGQKEQGLAFDDVVELPIARENFACFSVGEAAIAEVMRFVNQDHVGQFLDAFEAIIRAFPPKSRIKSV